MKTISLRHAGRDRHYLLVRPATAPSGRLPVVVVLHGTGGTAEWANDETNWSRTAEAHGILLVLPQGLPPDPTKPARFLSNPPRWNDGATRPGDALHAEFDDVAFLSAVIDDVVDRRSGDGQRLGMTGFSNGAGMTFRFAAERADRLAAIAPVAGYCWQSNPAPSRRVPTLYIVGEADPLIPLVAGSVRLPWGNRTVDRPGVWDSLRAWAGAVGCQPEPERIGEAGGITNWSFPGEIEFEVVTVAGLGHHWPGGQGQLNPRIGGVPSDRLDANEHIWAFFHKMMR